MLKHTSPMKASPSPPPLQQSPLNLEYDPIKGTCREVLSEDLPHHRRSHSDDLIPITTPIMGSGGDQAMAEDKPVYQVGLWQGVSQASVRRGLSFNSRRAPDSLSFRSVRSEGRGVLHVSSSPSKHSNNAMSLTSLKGEAPSFKTDLKNFKGEILSLKSLLKLPGIRGHARIVENARSSTSSTTSQLILSPDTLSLGSADSCFSNSNSGRTSSRSWSSNASSNDSHISNNSESSGSNDSTSEPTSTTLKVFAKCLRSDIEYKTISVSSRATCREVVAMLLTKYRMKHRDPNLFYLTMEVTVRRWSGLPVRSLLVLEEGARPAQLVLCRPPGDYKFMLQMRKGGVLKIHDTVLSPGSQYKSLLVSARTTSEEVVQLLLNCYSRKENKHYYALHEVRRSPEYSDRYLRPDERPLEVKATWPRDRQSEFIFVLRRNMTQALYLRKLSMRNLQLNKQILAETCKFKDPKTALQNGTNIFTRQTSGTVCVASIVGVVKKDSPPPLNNTQQHVMQPSVQPSMQPSVQLSVQPAVQPTLQPSTQPFVQPMQSHPASSKPQEETFGQDFDEAVIDCTEVLPKMVTISRRSPQSKSTTDAFASKTSDSLSPSTYTQVTTYTQPTPYSTTTTTTTIIPQCNNTVQQEASEADSSKSDSIACVNTGTQTKLTLKSRSSSLKSLNCTSSTEASNKISTGTQAEESSTVHDADKDITISEQNNCVEYVNISPTMVQSNAAQNTKTTEMVQTNASSLTLYGSKSTPDVEYVNLPPSNENPLPVPDVVNSTPAPRVEYVNLAPASPKKNRNASLPTSDESPIHEYVNLTPKAQKSYSASSNSPPSYQAPSPPSYQAPCPPFKSSESPPSYEAPCPPINYAIGPPLYPAPSPPVLLPTSPPTNEPIPDLNASVVISQVIARHLNGSIMSQIDNYEHSFFSHGENSTVIPANLTCLTKLENTIKETKESEISNNSCNQTEINTDQNDSSKTHNKCKHNCQHQHCFYI